MLFELKPLFDKFSGRQPLFGGSGGRGGDGPDKDDKEGKEGKEGGKEKEGSGKDPFENFDFSRFKSSRPRPESGSDNKPNSTPRQEDQTPKERPPVDDELPPRRTPSGGGNVGGFGRGNFGGFDRGNFGNFGGSTQLPQFNIRRPGRGAITLIIIALVIIALFVFGPMLISFWVDLMWFDEVGQTGVLWTRIWAPLAIFAIAFVLTFVTVMINVGVARRFGPSGPVLQTSADNPLSGLLAGGVRFLNVLFIIGAIIISLILAGAASGNWQSLLFFLNASNGWNDQKETVFNNSIGFYVFDVPFFSFLQGWLAGLFIVALVASMAIYFLRFTLSGRAFSFTPAIKTHVSVLGALILGLFALGYQIANWNLVYSNRGRVYGASATDVEAQFPANTILTFVVAAMAILLLVNIFIRNTRLGVRLLIIAGSVWLGSHILIGSAFPAAYQNFSVKPNEITKERPYIENTIKMTRKAYGLEFDKDLKVVPFQGTAQLGPDDIKQNPYIQENARLWDYDKLRNIYDLTQTLRPYYDFADIDIDRYNLAPAEGQAPRKTQVLLGARELKPDGISNKTWQSLHLQYTHGYGIQASPVNQVDSSGRPLNLITQSFPYSSTVLPVPQPRIYFGQGGGTADYSVVGTNLDEIDFPVQSSSSAPETKYKYTGKGGIPLSNWFVKAAMSVKLGDFNLLISDAIADNSRLVFRRSIAERVQLIAPYLRYDADPYLVVSEGRLYWIQDAYTVSDRFPHSNPYGEQRRGANTFNYIRNSVKVVINAYDGTTTFYLMDKPSVDPIAQTYANIYPNLFKPISQMPAALRAHIRYPEDLFKVQTQIYSTYHVTDPDVFYNNQELWQTPADPRPADSRPGTSGAFEPYYLVTRLPGEKEVEFVLINVFQQQNRVTLVSWLAARMDGDNYGQLVSYNFNNTVNIDGPQQFFSKVQSLPDFSRQQSLFNSGTSRLPPGPIIIIPVDNSVLYVMPYYLQSATNALPQLQFVATGANERVYVAQPGTDDDRTKLLPNALTEVFTRGQAVIAPGSTAPPVPGQTPLPVTTPPGGTPAPVTTPSGTAPANVEIGPTIGPSQQASINALTRSIAAHNKLASDAFAAGDTAKGNAEIEAANRDLARLRDLLGR